MKRAHWILLLLLLLCNGCATSLLRDAAHERIQYWRGDNPQAYVTAKGEFRVFEMGLYCTGSPGPDPLYSWYHKDLHLNVILRSLTNGQTSVKVRITPQSDEKPDEAVLPGSGYYPIPVQFVIFPSDSVLPYFKRDGTMTDTGTREVSLITYLESHPPQTISRQGLVYLNQYSRDISVWYDRDGLVSGHHFVVLHWNYPSYSRWYLYAFAPVTVAFDIVTLPIQWWYGARHFKW